MERDGPSAPSSFINKNCRTQSPQSSIIKYPTFTSLTQKNFQHAVDFNSQAKWPCRSSWYADVNSLHIRNRQILDLPFSKPMCCSEIHDVLLDRKKVKKLQKYGLTKPVRKRVSNLKVEKMEKCTPLDTGEKRNITRFPECYTLKECSSEDEADDSGDCSDDEAGEGLGSSPSKDGGKKKMDKEVKKDWKALLHVKDRLICEAAVAGEISKHKMGQDIKLNLKKVV